MNSQTTLGTMQVVLALLTLAILRLDKILVSGLKYGRKFSAQNVLYIA